jgi:receptor protein-tyrosine kinase
VSPYLEDNACRNDWSLADCLRVLYRRKATLVGLTCLGLLATIVVTATRPRIYESRASLEIQAWNETFLDLRDIYPAALPSADSPVYLQTQAEALQQDSLLEQVAAKLNLTSFPEYDGPQGVLRRLHKDISIAPARNSRILQIVSEARSASRAADLANTLAAMFIEQSVKARQAAASQTYQSLVQQLGELRSTFRPDVHGPKGASSASAVDANRRVYDAMLQKAYNAWLASRLPSTNIRLINAAEPPTRPHRPNWPLNLAIGTLGGLLMSVAWVMLQEQHKSVLRMPGEASTYLEVPELGAIPQARRWSPFGIIIPGADNGKPRIERAALEQGAGISESFRATVASILSTSRNGGHSRVLVVTSSQAMEGKTTIVSNLGIALAAISRKVLLIDGDLRRPRLHKLFDQPNSWGLSDVLSEKNAIDELPLDVLAKKTSIPHLYLLPSGASTDNIFGLLNSGRMSRLLPLFREEFDYVLVDAPPCLEFSDARIMARYAEESLLVVRANYTDRRIAQTAIQRLRLDGIPLLGVILNRWDPKQGDSYAYRTPRSPIYRGAA